MPENLASAETPDALGALLRETAPPRVLQDALIAVRVVVVNRWSRWCNIYMLLMLLIRTVRRNLGPMSEVGVVVILGSASKNRRGLHPEHG